MTQPSIGPEATPDTGLPDLQYTGAVLSGRGKAAGHIEEDLAEFRAVTGEDIIPGSLNIVLYHPLLLNTATAKVLSEGDRLIWPAHLFDQPVWIYRFPHAPLHVVEIISTQHLRDLFHLEDAQTVSLNIASAHVLKLSLRQRIAWALIWKGRESWSYHRDGYYQRTRNISIELGATQAISGKGFFRALLGFIRRGFR